ncbi:MAG: hypothetical protein LBF95_07000 [Treponema sp.]|jgi:hypothetical protein|nr:hypothetical protein [Treponema sp.]
MVILSLPLSCEKNEVVRLDPPAMPPLSREEIGYGVINVSYTHMADKPDSRSLSLGYLRRGSVVRVLERRAGSAAGDQVPPESWVLVESPQGADARGWLPELVIDLYPTEAQARTASESLVQ